MAQPRRASHLGTPVARMKRSVIRDRPRDMRLRSRLREDDDVLNGTLRDGEAMHVPLEFADGRQHHEDARLRRHPPAGNELYDGATIYVHGTERRHLFGVPDENRWPLLADTTSQRQNVTS
jgi:hypothetical protein